MNMHEVVVELKRLYDVYRLERDPIDNKSDDEIIKGINGYLEKLQNDKLYKYSLEDRKLINEISFYFG